MKYRIPKVDIGLAFFAADGARRVLPGGATSRSSTVGQSYPQAMQGSILDTGGPEKL
jgi:hypothetical protein